MWTQHNDDFSRSFSPSIKAYVKSLIVTYVNDNRNGMEMKWKQNKQSKFHFQQISAKYLAIRNSELFNPDEYYQIAVNIIQKKILKALDWKWLQGMNKDKAKRKLYTQKSL